MSKFREKMYKFMQGRYGTDQLYYALFGTWFVLLILSCFGFVKNSTILSVIVNLLMWAAIILAIFRSMSRKTIQRARENAFFLKGWRAVKGFFKGLWIRIRDIRKYRYRVCPYCHGKLRLPIKRGTHKVRCPKCRETFEVKILL